MSWGEIYNTSWWGVALDTARTVKARPDFFGSQLNLLTSEQPNLVTPTNSTSNWINARGNSTLSVVGTKIRATQTSGTTFGLSTAITTVIGKTYYIKSDGFKNNTNGNFLIRVSNIASLSPAYYEEASLSSQTVSTNGTFIATATTTYIGFLATIQTVGDYIETDNVSVQLVRAELDQIEAKKCLADWIHTTALKDLNN